MEYVEKASKVFLETGTKFPRSIIWAMGIIKFAAAKVNNNLGLLDDDMANVIMEISMDIAKGKHDDLIVVDVFQTGSGTGLNMNINEAISKIARDKYKIDIHPNDHVNMGQSSNDVVPTAIRMAVIYETKNKLVPAVESFIGKLREVSHSLKGIVKPGRTHLRDALPVSMDMEFQAYLNSFSNTLNLIPPILKNISEVPIGGTAVGTGFNTHPHFPRKILTEINKITGLSLTHGLEPSKGMRLVTDLITLSAILRILSLDLLKLSQDIRLMYSGPLTGFGEIDIEQELPGSSMMPGKKNPVTVEAVMQAACQVIGLDYSNTLASTLGELELAMSFPLIGYNLILQILLVTEALNKFSLKVLSKVTVKRERCKNLALKSPALITAVAPIIGYDNATKVAERMSKGLTLEDALKEIGLPEDKIKELLDNIMKTTPGFHL